MVPSTYRRVAADSICSGYRRPLRYRNAALLPVNKLKPRTVTGPDDWQGKANLVCLGDVGNCIPARLQAALFFISIPQGAASSPSAMRYRLLSKGESSLTPLALVSR